MRKLLLILFCIVFVSVSACAKYSRYDVQLLTREEALKATDWKWQLKNDPSWQPKFDPLLG